MIFKLIVSICGFMTLWARLLDERGILNIVILREQISFSVLRAEE